MSKDIKTGRQFVCGFMFDALDIGARVLLTQKQRPKWQAGKLNGIGGEVNRGESFNQAMMREFREETGNSFDKWTYFCRMRYIDHETIHFFYGVGALFYECKTQTDEPLINLSVQTLIHHYDHCVADVRWLVPMAFGMAQENCRYLEVIKCDVLFPNG
jgi:8-oxo-dGTP diphosphatase